MSNPYAPPDINTSAIQEIREVNIKRKKLSNILSLVTWAFILGDWYGFSEVLGVRTFIIGFILIFARGFIVRKIYPVPASAQALNLNMKNPANFRPNPDASSDASNMYEFYVD